MPSQEIASWATPAASSSKSWLRSASSCSPGAGNTSCTACLKKAGWVTGMWAIGLIARPSSRGPLLWSWGWVGGSTSLKRSTSQQSWRFSWRGTGSPCSCTWRAPGRSCVQRQRQRQGQAILCRCVQPSCGCLLDRVKVGACHNSGSKTARRRCQAHWNLALGQTRFLELNTTPFQYSVALQRGATCTTQPLNPSPTNQLAKSASCREWSADMEATAGV